MLTIAFLLFVCLVTEAHLPVQRVTCSSAARSSTPQICEVMEHRHGHSCSHWPINSCETDRLAPTRLTSHHLPGSGGRSYSFSLESPPPGSPWESISGEDHAGLGTRGGEGGGGGGGGGGGRGVREVQSGPKGSASDTYSYTVNPLPTNDTYMHHELP